MTSPFQVRRDRIASALKKDGIGAVAVVPGANFYYLTGLQFHLMERPTVLIITSDGAILAIMPELERLKWSAAFPAAETFYWQDSDGYGDAFDRAAAALGDCRIGVEGQRMRVFEVDALRSNCGQGAVFPADQVFNDLRMSKDPAEVARVEKAIAISETALSETLAEVRAGDSERTIAALLKSRMLAGGADGFAFDPLVLSGGGSANPHGTSGEAPLIEGAPLLIDFGASFDGYNADITRTVFCGHATDRHTAIYETVLRANTHGRDLAAPGLTAHDLDEQVTGVLAASDFPGLIVHKTGHGLGLDVHEAPHIMIGNHTPLVGGALITIEPGLYAENDIGVRIEDDVLITESGARSLTSFSRELTIIGS